MHNENEYIAPVKKVSSTISDSGNNGIATSFDEKSPRFHFRK